MRSFLLALLLLCLPATAKAQLASSFSMTWETRYDDIDAGRQRSRIQGALRAGASMGVSDWFELYTLISTGQRYASRWSDIRDLKENESSDFRLFVRHLYLQRRFEGGGWRGRLQLGGIPPVKNIASTTGIETAGWIDGLRGEIGNEHGLLELVVGGIDDLRAPNFFTRKRSLNYQELELTLTPIKALVAEIAVERFHDNVHVRGEARVKVPGTGGCGLTLSVEGLRTVTTGGSALTVLAAGAPLGCARKDWARRLRVRAFYNYVGRAVGLRGQLADDFYRFGHAFTVLARGEILEGPGLRWFVRVIANDMPRIDLGLALSLGWRHSA